MFDAFTTNPVCAVLARIRCFFFDHGHELASAAALLGGAAAEARVISCGVDLEDATRVTRRLTQDIAAFYRLLGLRDVHDPDRLESAYFSEMHPTHPSVDNICLLTDLLKDLLNDIERAGHKRTQ